jgi:hypothetical protein
MIIYIPTEMLAVALTVQLLRSTRPSLALMKLDFLSALCLQELCHQGCCVTISNTSCYNTDGEVFMRAEFSFTSGRLDGHWYDMGGHGVY